VRDYIHVCDLAEAHRLGMEYLLKHDISEHFNLGCARGYSIREVLETAKRVTGRPIKTCYTDRREGDPPVLVGANAKAREVLQWSPRYSLEETIASAWKWHVQKNNS
jgi:UDP-glucose 4-epimerase